MVRGRGGADAGTNVGMWGTRSGQRARAVQSRRCPRSSSDELCRSQHGLCEVETSARSRGTQCRPADECSFPRETSSGRRRLDGTPSPSRGGKKSLSPAHGDPVQNDFVGHAHTLQDRPFTSGARTATASRFANSCSSTALPSSRPSSSTAPSPSSALGGLCALRGRRTATCGGLGAGGRFGCATDDSQLVGLGRPSATDRQPRRQLTRTTRRPDSDP